MNDSWGDEGSAKIILSLSFYSSISLCSSVWDDVFL